MRTSLTPSYQPAVQNTARRTWMSKIFSFLIMFFATARDAADTSWQETEYYFLNTITSSEATEVTMPIKENQMVVELPIPELLAFTLFGST